jgi:H+/gluconate symporter-like permease
MYRRTTTVDTQWVIFAGYWTAILGTFIAFYTLSRVKEFYSNTPYSNKGEWLSENTPNAAVTTTTYTTTEFDDEDLSLYDDGEEEEDA